METKQIPFAICFSVFVSLSEGLSLPCQTTNFNFFLLKICWLFFHSLRCGGDEASEQASKAKQASKRPPTRRGRNALHSDLCLQFIFRLPFYLLHITARERPRYSGAERRKRQRERGRNDGCCEPRRVLAGWGPTPSRLAYSLSSLSLFPPRLPADPNTNQASH
jgi:hypothetical protein